MELGGKVALVTGASRGIGEAIALTFAREGADLSICCRSSVDDLEKVAAKIRAMGRKCLTFVLDVADGEAAANMVEKTIADLGKLDILVNNAANTACIQKDFHTSTEEEWDEEINSSVKGTLFFSRAAIPHMIAKKSGNIINLTSVATKSFTGKLALYAAAKGAVASFSRAIAQELGPDGIRVNCVAPGPTVVPSFMEYWPTEMKEQMINESLLKKFVEPQDIAEMALFFASDKSKAITGQEYSVDGGRTF
ncbi:MAG: 3-oxoacyl-ACP reductase FabG [Coriobacteriales bacterium]|jgi:NAD(P)-dependent dehydrogenase (short-subunit alcohol dehydrogenase family)|nr:3-oxoacyl-ACP reductase FabG [Coriobacteriales bacterium]